MIATTPFEPSESSSASRTGTSSSTTSSTSKLKQRKRNLGKFKLFSRNGIRIALGAIFLIIVLVGSGAGLYLTKQSQDIRQQASGGNSCASYAYPSINNPDLCETNGCLVSNVKKCKDFTGDNCPIGKGCNTTPSKCTGGAIFSGTCNQKKGAKEYCQSLSPGECKEKGCFLSGSPGGQTCTLDNITCNKAFNSTTCESGSKSNVCEWKTNEGQVTTCEQLSDGNCLIAGLGVCRLEKSCVGDKTISFNCTEKPQGGDINCIKGSTPSCIEGGKSRQCMKYANPDGSDTYKWTKVTCAYGCNPNNGLCVVQKCAPGTSRCFDGKRVQKCVQVDGGDYQYKTESCPGDKVCDAGICKSEATGIYDECQSTDPSTCTAGNKVKKCDIKSNGNRWKEVSCDYGYSCAAGVCKKNTGGGNTGGGGAPPDYNQVCRSIPDPDVCELTTGCKVGSNGKCEKDPGYVAPTPPANNPPVNPPNNPPNNPPTGPGSCDNGVKEGETACNSSIPGSQFRCGPGSTPGNSKWIAEPCAAGYTCQGKSCQQGGGTGGAGGGVGGGAGGGDRDYGSARFVITGYAETADGKKIQSQGLPPIVKVTYSSGGSEKLGLNLNANRLYDPTYAYGSFRANKNIDQISGTFTVTAEVIPGLGGKLKPIPGSKPGGGCVIDDASGSYKNCNISAFSTTEVTKYSGQGFNFREVYETVTAPPTQPVAQTPTCSKSGKWATTVVKGQKATFAATGTDPDTIKGGKQPAVGFYFTQVRTDGNYCAVTGGANNPITQVATHWVKAGEITQNSLSGSVQLDTTNLPAGKYMMTTNITDDDGQMSSGNPGNRGQQCNANYPINGCNQEFEVVLPAPPAQCLEIKSSSNSVKVQNWINITCNGGKAGSYKFLITKPDGSTETQLKTSASLSYKVLQQGDYTFRCQAN